MLRQASIAIAKRSQSFTAVARSAESLQSLAQVLGGASETKRRYLRLNWDEPDQFLSALSRHVEEFVPPSIVLAWLHDAKLGSRVAKAVSTKGSSCDFFQVIGSAAAKPNSDVSSLRDEIEAQGDVTYHQIVLGFKRGGGGSRWLTDAEISTGVLEAILASRPFNVVGVVTPWEERP